MNLTHKKLTTLLFLLVSMLVYTGCKKELISDGKAVPFSYLERDDFFETNAPRPERFTFSAGTSNFLEGQQGTCIYIPENAFVDQNGNPVKGQFDFELLEVFTVSDMIFAGKMTVSGGQLLSSGGEFYVNAEQNGQQLKLAPGKSVNIEVPTNNPTPQMAFFRGDESSGTFDWVADTSTTVTTVVDTSSQQQYYSFACPTLWNWMNCDYYFSDPRPKTNVEIQVPAGYDQTNTSVFVYVPVDNIMVQVYHYSNGSYYINGSYQLPVGLQVYFIGIKPGVTSVEYALQQNTIVNNHVEVLSFSTITLAQLQALLAAL